MTTIDVTRSFIKQNIVDLLRLPVIERETLLIYAFGSKTSERQTYDVVEIELENIYEAKKRIKIKVIVIDYITKGQIQVSSSWVRRRGTFIRRTFQKQIILDDVGDSTEIHLLIGSDYIWDVLRDENIRLGKLLMATDSIFRFVLQGKEDELNCRKIHVSHISVSREEINDRVKCLWDLEAIGISEPEVLKTDTEILEKFEQDIKF